MTAQNIWVIDDDDTMRWVLEKTLNDAGLNVTTFQDSFEALEAFESGQPDVVLTDIRMPGMDGLTLLSKIKAKHTELPVIIMTAHSDLDSAVSSYQTGAFEYLPKPFDIDEAVTLVQRALQHVEHSKVSQKAVEDITPQKPLEIIGESPAMQEVFRAIGRLSQSHITVLINGQSGTGKELVAHALHKHSPRAKKPFIALNMAAIPKDLIETELFGHEKGAFTGANTQRQGRFEQSNGGTLFLDEIGDMPFETQTRLLRVLADGEFYRIGGHMPVKVDVRIIAATHQNLEKLVSDGKFREDLFHRLNVIRIHIPKLSERPEDIPTLADYFLLQAAQELKVEPKILQNETKQILSELPWPGNVRQLQNTCRWITVMASGREVLPMDLPQELLDLIDGQRLQQATAQLATADAHQTNTTLAATAAPQTPAAQTPTMVTGQTAAQNLDSSQWVPLLYQWISQELKNKTSPVLDTATPLFEKTVIEAALHTFNGKKRLAAERLGWGRNTLTRKLKELNIESSDEADEE